MNKMRSATKGFKWVHTNIGEERCAHRKEGMSAYPDETCVPSLWVEKGYVRQVATEVGE